VGDKAFVEGAAYENTAKGVFFWMKLLLTFVLNEKVISIDNFIYSIMKRIIVIIGLLLISLGSFAQEKGMDLLMDGMKELQRKNYELALVQINNAMEKGNLKAYVVLADLYITGEGVKKNINKAISLLESVGEKGDLEMMRHVGTEYFEREEIRNVQQGLDWLNKAAGGGDAVSMCILGDIYLKGVYGVDVDKQKGLQWFRKAAAQQDSYGQAMVAKLYFMGLTTVSPTAEQIKLLVGYFFANNLIISFDGKTREDLQLRAIEPCKISIRTLEGATGNFYQIVIPTDLTDVDGNGNILYKSDCIRYTLTDIGQSGKITVDGKLNVETKLGSGLPHIRFDGGAEDVQILKKVLRSYHLGCHE